MGAVPFGVVTRSIAMPMWVRDEPHPRAVVEAADPAKRHALVRVLADHGYSVRGCGGPEEADERCPLADGVDCVGVIGTDVVVHAMRHTDPRNREVLRRLRQRYPETPVVVEAPGPELDRHPEDFEGCHVVRQPITSASLLEAVGSACGEGGVVSSG